MFFGIEEGVFSWCSQAILTSTGGYAATGYCSWDEGPTALWLIKALPR